MAATLVLALAAILADLEDGAFVIAYTRGFEDIDGNWRFETEANPVKRATIEKWLSFGILLPPINSAKELVEAYAESQVAYEDYEILTAQDYKAMREAQAKEAQVAADRELERKLKREMRKGGFDSIDVPFLVYLSDGGKLANYDREEMRAEAFAAGGMQGLNDFSDEWNEGASLCSDLLDWCQRNAPLTFIRFQEALQSQAVTA